MSTRGTPDVTLFVPCLVDQFYPKLAVKLVRLLQKLGAKVSYPISQTCCGQPAYNAGYPKEAKKLGERFLKVFSSARIVIAPSGSCVNMVRNVYPEFGLRPGFQIYEASEFIVDLLGLDDLEAQFHGKVAYHDSCHLFRQLGLSNQPRWLLNKVKGLKLIETEPLCCGFGGIFSARFPRIATAMAQQRVHTVLEKGINHIAVGDAGCLLHLSNYVRKRSIPLRVLHYLELLET